MQMAIAMYPTIVATAILFVPAVTAIYARLDLWWSPIWASSLGFVTVYVMVRLSRLFPQQSFIEYIERIIGRVAGKIVGLTYLVFLLHINGIVIREYGEFIVSSFLSHTPIIVIMGTIVCVSAFAVIGGIEPIMRCAQLFVPAVVVLGVAIIALLIPSMKLTHMFPMFENGLLPSIKGAVVPSGWFSEYMLISFLLPSIKDRNKAIKYSFISVTSVMAIMVLVNYSILLMFGNGIMTMSQPLMTATRQINLVDFIQHLESIVMAIWVLAVFLKITMFYYVLVLGTGQLLKLSERRSVIWPIGVLLTAFSIWCASSLQELSDVISTTLPFYLMLFTSVIPIVLLCIALIRNKRGSKPECKPL